MRIMIAGATGLVGQALVSVLSVEHDVIVLGREEAKLRKKFPNHAALTWSQVKQDALSDVDVVINLAGENIGHGRWTIPRKRKIMNSRMEATARLASLCALMRESSPRLINASAIGIYGKQRQDSVDEYTSLDTDKKDFLSEVGIAWESALQPAISAGVSVTVLRLGVILSKKGGMLKQLLPSYRLGLGAIIGDGKQKVSWVTLPDVVRAIQFLLANDALTGTFNVVAEGVVTQANWAKSLARHCHRPCVIRLPKCVVMILFGQMGEELLLSGIDVKSKRLTNEGFDFRDKTLCDAWKRLHC